MASGLPGSSFGRANAPWTSLITSVCSTDIAAQSRWQDHIPQIVMTRAVPCQPLADKSSWPHAWLLGWHAVISNTSKLSWLHALSGSRSGVQSAHMTKQILGEWILRLHEAFVDMQDALNSKSSTVRNRYTTQAAGSRDLTVYDLYSSSLSLSPSMPKMAALAGLFMRDAAANEAVNRPVRCVRLLLSCCSACTSTNALIKLGSCER